MPSFFGDIGASSEPLPVLPAYRGYLEEDRTGTRRERTAPVTLKLEYAVGCGHGSAKSSASANDKS